jgi:hypothetical protein
VIGVAEAARPEGIHRVIRIVIDYLTMRAQIFPADYAPRVIRVARRFHCAVAAVHRGGSGTVVLQLPRDGQGLSDRDRLDSAATVPRCRPGMIEPVPASRLYHPQLPGRMGLLL